MNRLRYLDRSHVDYQALLEIHTYRTLMQDTFQYTLPVMPFKLGMRYLHWCKDRNILPVHPVLPPLSWRK